MTSASGTCAVKYDQAGNSNYNAASEVTESVTAAKADQAITVTTHAPANAVVGSSFDVAANAPGGSVAYSSGGACSNSGTTFTMVSSSGTCAVMYDQAGDANYNAAPEVTETVNPGQGRPVDLGDYACAGQCGLRVAVHGGRERAGRRDRLLERRLLHEQRRDVHDDAAARLVHRQVRPGRRRELQRRA